jgi:hypothetical protein
LDLSYEKVEALINEISIGGRFVQVSNLSGTELVLFISHPTALDKVYAELQYQKSYDKAISEGFLTVEETSDIMRRKGMFTKEDEEKVEKLKQQIEAQEALLQKTTKVPARRDGVKENIRSLREKLMTILQKKETGLDFCAERKAQECKYLYLSWRNTRDKYTQELIWPTKEQFDNELDIVLRRKTLLEFIKLSAGIETSVLRFISRHNLWRIRYITSTKTGTPLFSRPIEDYSVDQLSLAYWSYFYSSIFEMLPDERPPEYIIEDDESLDAFMKSYSEEKNREASASREKRSSDKKGVKSAWEHGETLVMRSNPLYKEINYSETVESVRNKKITDLTVKK